MNFSYLSFPQGVERSPSPLQLPIHPHWPETGEASSVDWPPLSRIAVTGWAVGFVGATALYFIWPFVSHAFIPV